MVTLLFHVDFYYKAIKRKKLQKILESQRRSMYNIVEGQS